MHPVNLADFESIAQERLPRGVYDFSAGGAEDDDTTGGVGGDVNVAGFVDGGAAVAGSEGGAAGSLLEEVGDVFEISGRLCGVR